MSLRIVVRLIQVEGNNMRTNVNDDQVINIAIEVLAGKETVGYARPTCSTSEVMTRFASKGMHVGATTVAMAMQRHFPRARTEDGSVRWTV